MKKLIFSLAAVAGLTLGAYVNNESSISKEPANALTLANIEALTYTEWGHDSGCDGPGSGCLLQHSEWYHDKKGDYPD